ncbi:MAG: hypothetical protein AB7S54_05955, partial [Bacteroidales bacterium]
GSSLGLSRYMAAVVPFMAVMATRGLILFSLMFQILFKREWIRVLALILGVFSVIHIPFVIQNYPIALDATSKTLKTASEWIKTEEFDNAKIFYTDPIFYFLHGINPFDATKSQSSFNSSTNPSEGMKNGDLLIYDEHFSPIAGVELDKLTSNPELKLLKTFDPTVPTLVFHRLYRVAVFQKVEEDSAVASHNISVLNDEEKTFSPIISFDFDSTVFQPESRFIGSSKINPNKYLRVKRSREFYLTNHFELDSVSFVPPFELQVAMRLFMKTPDEKLKYYVEVNKMGEIIAKDFDIDIPYNGNPEEWHNLKFKVLIPEITSPDGVKISTRVWNKRKGEYLIDDYRVSYRTK